MKKFLLALFFCFSLTVAGTAAVAETTYTNDTIEQLLSDATAQKSHRVMAGQRARLRAISDGFLFGDDQSIKTNAEAISDAIQETVRLYPPASENSASVWAALSDIVKETELLKAEVLKKDYSKAYTHFAKIQASCIQCHQVSRSWGKFEELPEKVAPLIVEPAPEPPEAPLPEKKAPADSLDYAPKEIVWPDTAAESKSSESEEIPFGRPYTLKQKKISD